MKTVQKVNCIQFVEKLLVSICNRFGYKKKVSTTLTYSNYINTAKGKLTMQACLPMLYMSVLCLLNKQRNLLKKCMPKFVLEPFSLLF